MVTSDEQLKNNELLTVKELAQLLKISQSSVYRMVEKRVLSFHKIQSGLRFYRNDVDEYLNSCRFEVIDNEHVYGSKNN
jgi:excisionase family DNA binding protein